MGRPELRSLALALRLRSNPRMEFLTHLAQSFNEATLRPAAVLLDVLLLRLPRALYFGFRAAVVEATGASAELASIVSGFLAAAVLLLLFLICRTVARRLRLKNHGFIAARAGAVLFWFGVAIGIYQARTLAAGHPTRTSELKDN